MFLLILAVGCKPAITLEYPLGNRVRGEAEVWKAREALIIEGVIKRELSKSGFICEWNDWVERETSTSMWARTSTPTEKACHAALEKRGIARLGETKVEYGTQYQQMQVGPAAAAPDKFTFLCTRSELESLVSIDEFNDGDLQNVKFVARAFPDKELLSDLAACPLRALPSERSGSGEMQLVKNAEGLYIRE